MVDLKFLLGELEILDLVGSADREINSINFDSRAVGEGDLFVAVRGTQTDGHRYISSVVERGVAAVICEVLPDAVSDRTTYVVVRDSSFALGWIAQAFFEHPSRKFTLVGVTGTNGKTTTATLLYRLFSRLGHKCGLLSTIRNYVGSEVIPSTHTTGDAIQIARNMAAMVDAGCTHCFMEVTSHAVHQNRIVGLCFDGGVFTNLTQDHLDYHNTMDAYAAVKKSYFDSLPSQAFALTNLDSPHGLWMVADTRARRFTYGSASNADYPLEVVRSTPDGLELKVGGIAIRSTLLGTFNAYNLAATAAAANLLGASLEEVSEALLRIPPVEGRMEIVTAASGATIIVDFAHTPDAVENVLDTISAFREPGGRIITVLGCGGDRDQEKRPIMARAACDRSDLVVITADNPRSESPADIAAEMLGGLTGSNGVEVILDRRAAIFHACAAAGPRDIVLIAGKGHEKFQEIAGQKLPFDDVIVAKEAASARPHT
ncbi:MAG: UDP-N-acetylmuramoyl-L-alanyl-D-glutamate--2,6-diaminopimelate ligase [Alphaproteobacteria bacterium]|nr:UDP-N-acetylmuramoyl-L-alanyl-D-glutamate--2,6-diaminopimelate ligase [Alphaproteobacteria bacterium]MBV9371099.1 UDP-N-acetylmuramoyl-L-alanyl-D-glutamate--2,6-diaminopimelate ligase [Alphaproteobacteria bacterium]MBV9901527.1 UDP-N-acetylmuramoyl-L-alanyl-D-glutamate--2,6-diaminopimelate ligase [Alphaproteobacteria bacterium]